MQFGGRTHSSFSDEVGDREDIAGVGIDVNLIPAVDGLVLNLNRMHKLGRAIRLGEVVQRCWPLVVSSVECGLNLGNHRAGSNSGLGGRKGLGLDEGGAERDDVVTLPGDVGDGVEEGDALEGLAHVGEALA